MRFNGSKGTKNRPLFRAHAVERYIESREAVVLPRLIRPKMALFLLLLLGLLMLGGGTAWWVNIPIFVTGSVIIISTPSSGYAETGALALFPPESLSALRVGQEVVLRLGATGEPLARPITVVEPEVLSPAEIIERFELSPAVAMNVRVPSVATLVSLGATLNGLPTRSYAGGVYPAEASVGMRRLLSFLPVLGRLLEGS